MTPTPDTGAVPVLPAELMALSDKQDPFAGEWFVEHAYTADGLSAIVDGRQHGMFPVKGEVPEIELACAAVNYVRALAAGQRAASQAPADGAVVERMARALDAILTEMEETGAGDQASYTEGHVALQEHWSGTQDHGTQP